MDWDIAKRIWSKNADENGWISKSPEDICGHIDCHDERKFKVTGLYNYLYNHDIEFKDDSESVFRFKE